MYSQKRDNNGDRSWKQKKKLKNISGSTEWKNGSERESKRLIEFSKAVAAAAVVVEHLKTVCDVWMSVGHASNSIRQSDQFCSFFFFSAFITYILSVCVSCYICLGVCVREQIKHHCGFCMNGAYTINDTPIQLGWVRARVFSTHWAATKSTKLPFDFLDARSTVTIIVMSRSVFVFRNEIENSNWCWRLNYIVHLMRIHKKFSVFRDLRSVFFFSLKSQRSIVSF